jgi:hypothetical protein
VPFDFFFDFLSVPPPTDRPSVSHGNAQIKGLGVFTYHWRVVVVVIVGLVLPTQIVVVLDDEAGILVLPFALFGFLFRVSGQVVFGQVVGKSRHA